jgi:hypothetical protein
MNRLADIDAPEPEIDVDEFYATQLNAFTKTLSVALASSQAAAGLNAGYRRHWASVLFTRMCSFGISLPSLSPGSIVNPDSLHWDFSSAASLARNLLECDLVFFYLCIDPDDEDTWLTRLNLIQLHDCLERHEMFRCWGHNTAQLKGFLEQADELRGKLSKCASFNALSGNLRKELLKGKISQMMTQDEILLRMGVSAADVQHFRGYYRFLSSQAHTYPLGFYRMSEQNRTGLENRADKGYTAAALEFCGTHLKRAVQDFQHSFSDIVVFDQQSFDWKRIHRAS